MQFNVKFKNKPPANSMYLWNAYLCSINVVFGTETTELNKTLVLMGFL